jgi:AraC-like DNA-binding protein
MVTIQHQAPARSTELSDGGLRLRRHTHGRETVDELSTLVVLAGRAHVRAAAGDLIADQNRAVIVAGGTPLECTTAGIAASAYRGYWLGLDAAIVDQIGRAIDRPDAVGADATPVDATRAFALAVDQNLASSVQRLVDASLTGPDPFLTALYLHETVYGLMIAAGSERLREAARRQLQHDPVHAAIELMRGSLDQPLTISELADWVHMSPSALSQRFTRVTGQSPYQYLKRLRLERARQLLSSGVPVIEAALSVGYASPSHFSCEFKRKFGQTPGSVRHWRRNVWAKGDRCADENRAQQEIVQI